MSEQGSTHALSYIVSMVVWRQERQNKSCYKADYEDYHLEDCYVVESGKYKRLYVPLKRPRNSTRLHWVTSQQILEEN